MTSRRRSSNKNLGNSISDVRRRIRYLERKPIRTKIQNRFIKAASIAPSTITAEEVDFGTTVITTDPPADVIDNPKDGLLVVDPDTGAGQLYSEQQGDYIEITDATARATADGKNTIYSQTTAPSSASLKTNDIWYDTDDGNKLYVWNGTSWVNIQDTAIAAAAAAATAAQNTADGKNKVYRQSSTPTGTFATGDLWFDTANGDRISRWSGTAWVQYGLGYQAISSIDAGTISVGTLNAARIAANSLDVSVLRAGTLRAGTIYTGDIVASQITSGTISGNFISGGTITGAIINLAGTNSYGAFTLTNTLKFGSPSLTWGPTATPSFEIYQFAGGDGTVINADGTAGNGYLFIDATTRIEFQSPEMVSFYTIKMPSASSSASYGTAGLRNIYPTATAGTPSGGSDGDIVVVYT